MDLNKKTQTEQLMISTMDMLADPETNKGDIATFLKSSIDSSETLKDIMGEISDDVVAEIVKNDQSDMPSEDELDKSNTVGMTAVGGGLYKVLDMPKMTKQLKESFVQQPGREEARYLMDLYYQEQSKRIVLENQIRALDQGKDSDQPEIDSVTKEKKPKKQTQNRGFLEYYCFNTKMREDYIKQGLEMFSDSAYLGKWAKANKGIGPVIATCLLANLELRDNATGNDTDMHPSSWWDYCGLNNNRRPWIGRAQATEIVNDLVKENNGIIDDALVKKLCGISQWKYSHYETKAKVNGAWKKDKLIAATCIIPYNKNMKLVMYKIGHSFLMCKNKPDSLYGRLLKDRLDYETKKNEAGDYKDQAEKALATKNYGKDTVAYKYYIQGKLPPAHISQRCQRYVTKLFISHLFEAAYYNKYGKQAPAPYALLFCGHTDYIPPEVPYDSIPRDEEYVKLHPTQPLKKIITPIHFVDKGEE